MGDEDNFSNFFDEDNNDGPPSVKNASGFGEGFSQPGQQDEGDNFFTSSPAKIQSEFPPTGFDHAAQISPKQEEPQVVMRPMDNYVYQPEALRLNQGPPSRQTPFAAPSSRQSYQHAPQFKPCVPPTPNEFKIDQFNAARTPYLQERVPGPEKTEFREPERPRQTPSFIANPDRQRPSATYIPDGHRPCPPSSYISDVHRPRQPQVEPPNKNALGRSAMPSKSRRPNDPFALFNQYQDEMDKLQSKVKFQNEQIKRLSSQVQEMTQQWAGSQTELDKAKKEIVKREGEITTLNHAVDLCRSRYDTVVLRFKKMDGLPHCIEKLRKSHKHEVAAMNVTLTQLSESMNDTIKSLVHKVEAAQSELNERGQELLCLQGEDEAKGRKISELQFMAEKNAKEHELHKKYYETEISRISGDLQDMKSSLEQEKNKLKDSEELKLKLTEEITIILAAKTDLESKVADLECKLSQTSQEFETLKTESLANVEKLTQEILEKDKIIDDVKSKLENEVTASRELLAKFEEVNSESVKEKEVLLTNIEALKNELKLKLDENVVLENQKSILQEQKETSDAKCENLATELEAQKKTFEEVEINLKNELQLTKENETIIQEKLSKAEQELLDLNSNYQSKLNESSFSVGQLNSKNQTLMEKLHEMEEQQEQLAGLRQEGEIQLLKRIEEMKVELDKRGHEVRRYKDKLEEAMNEKNSEIRKLNLDLDRRSEQVGEFRKYQNMKENEIERLQKELEETRADVSKLREKNEVGRNYKTQIENLTKQVQKLQETNKRSQEEIVDLRSKVSHLKAVKENGTPVRHTSPRSDNVSRRLFPDKKRTFGFDSESNDEEDYKPSKTGRKTLKKSTMDTNDLYLEARGDNRYSTSRKEVSGNQVRGKAARKLNKSPEDDSGASGEWF